MNDMESPIKPSHRGIGRLFSPSTASKILVLLLIVAAVLVIITLAFGLLGRTKNLAKEDQYQAVFLTNGQVYFGKLSAANSNYLVLRDVYYLQQSEESAQAGEQNQQPQDNGANVSLVKLGDELHGPEDEMFIEEDKIIFWENLKDNGKVVEAINNR